ncbi:diguanylate cyclase [Meiothermus sp. QL-1]|uniref:GGDEF domain-containing protein n=1 Tax=Meiothermus sp. QL-1 TaxID=2058095 RepID=UPI000E0BD9F7|nr:sensor domain-containing diguanylate cyclase [Meiothermus sp. QL-1]RDI94944.1 diguanylate cyclase [Meiothermus sp. QL-1]
MTLPYPLILALSLAATAAAYALGLAGIYALPWLMIFTATVASLRGMGVGLAVALFSVGVIYIFQASLQEHLVMGAILLLSAYLADQVGASLRRAHRRAKQLAQVQDVFLQGMEVVPRFFNRQQLLLELPLMLSNLLQNTRSHVWVPAGDGQLRPLAEGAETSPLVGQAVREHRVVWTTQAPSRHWEHYEVALPLRMRDEVVAVLQLVRDTPWQKEELELTSRLARAIGYQLEHLYNLELRRLLLAVADDLASAGDKREVAERVLRHLLPALGMEAGAVLQYRQGYLQGLAWQLPLELRAGLEPLARQLTYRRGLAWQAYHSGMPQFTERYDELPEAIPELTKAGFKSLAAYPVHTRDAMKGRVVLVLGSRTRMPWTRSRKEILLGVERLLSSALERALLEEVHQRINRLLTEAWTYPSGEVYQHILEAAIELVPGSEAGSLWVREKGVYVCRAVLGPVWDCTKTQSEEEMQAWYGHVQSSPDSPRIRVEGSRANLCLPVSHQGRVLAYLNLDSLEDPEAFAEDSLATAQLFATPIASLVHELKNRQALEEAALTDELTGLYNRRAFEQRLVEEVERARRYCYPLSLLVLDLRNFKPINDRLGHAMGDRALVAVARALRQSQRGADLVFRWGGDEFVVLLPQTDAEGAQAAASRLSEAVSRVCLEGICLLVNVGRATFPAEADSAEALLALADARMYEDKKRVK